MASSFTKEERQSLRRILDSEETDGFQVRSIRHTKRDFPPWAFDNVQLSALLKKTFRSRKAMALAGASAYLFYRCEWSKAAIADHLGTTRRYVDYLLQRLKKRYVIASTT